MSASEEYSEAEEYSESEVEGESRKVSDEYFAEEEYTEEFSIKDLETFITLTECWERVLSGEGSIEELQQIYIKRRKVSRRRRRS